MKSLPILVSLWSLLAIPGNSVAQATHPDRTVEVSRAKADLQTTGHVFNTACGAFAITELAAWRMRSEGAGLLDKPGGNNCRGFAVDIIAYPDGAIFDVLINAETDNVPAWQIPGAGVVDPVRYRAAHDPEFDTAPPSLPAPTPVPPSELDARLTAIQVQIQQVHTEVMGVRASLEEHRRISRDWVDRTLAFLKNPLTISAIAGILAGKFVLPGK